MTGGREGGREVKGHETLPWAPAVRLPPPPPQRSHHPTYRDDSEDGINHTRANGGIDRLLNTCIFEDSCWIIEHLIGNKKRMQLWNSSCAQQFKRTLRKIHCTSQEVKESFPAFLVQSVSFLQRNHPLYLTSILFLILNSSYTFPFFLQCLFLLFIEVSSLRLLYLDIKVKLFWFVLKLVFKFYLFIFFE